MTALPMQMDEAAILREMHANERRALLGQPRINLVAFVRNVFDSQLVDALPFKTERDLYEYVIHLLEQRRPLSAQEKGRVGIVTATEFNTRRALAKIARCCANCDRAFRLDEQRYDASMAGAYAKVCADCMGETRGVPSSSIRQELRESGLGVEDYDADAVRCPACEEMVSTDDFDAKAKTCKACERKRMIESGEALEEWKWGRDS